MALASQRARRAARRTLREDPRSAITEVQHARLIAATIEVICQDGYANLTVSRVVARSRVSRKTFYDVFENREDGFLAAFEEVVERASQLMIEASGAEPRWPEGIRAALQRLLSFFDEEPGLARLLVVESLAAGDAVLRARAEILESLAATIEEGRAARTATGGPPVLTGEAIVGGVVSVLHTRVVQQCPQPLSELLGELMSMITLPYLGSRAARRQLNMPSTPSLNGNSAAKPARVLAGPGGDPLDGLSIRLTYRTARVLKVVGEHPGASNREIADGADVLDQGQISKLLARLARLGLIENRGAGQPVGAANAWQLTGRGRRLERAMRPH